MVGFYRKALLFSWKSPGLWDTALFTEGCRNPTEKQEKLLSHCGGWKAALPSAAGMDVEGSDAAQNNGTDCTVPASSVLLDASEPDLSSSLNLC